MIPATCAVDETDADVVGHAGHEVDDEAEGVVVAGHTQEADLFLGGDHGRARAVLRRADIEQRVETYYSAAVRVLEDSLHPQEDLCLGRGTDVAAFHGGDEAFHHEAVEGVHLPRADLRIGMGAHPGLGRGFRAAGETPFAGEPCLRVLLEGHLAEGLPMFGDGPRSGLASRVQLGQALDGGVLGGEAGLLGLLAPGVAETDCVEVRATRRPAALAGLEEAAHASRKLVRHD
ncbi:hypothetical protein ACFWNT_38735 [Streptomyces sp. NPDC058409]|uniref:hypothetical protein n=1 Tax=Streptomyces sp. NPDC058409 TaxID=3346484 RepID=UPI00366930D6